MKMFSHTREREREGEREGAREGAREGGREGGREEGREGGSDGGSDWDGKTGRKRAGEGDDGDSGMPQIRDTLYYNTFLRAVMLTSDLSD